MPDLLLANARPIGTAAPTDVLVRDGVIAAIGPGAAAHAERVDLDGRTLMPGLWDQHVHLDQWALARQRVDVSAADSAAAAIRLVFDRLDRAPLAPGTALIGYGFRDGLWPDTPTAALLDAAVGPTPVILVSGDLHCAWFSTAGLRYAGVGDHPTGLLREAEWLPLTSVVDRVDAATMDHWVTEAAADAAARGVVGVLDLEIADNVLPWRRRAAAGFDLLRVRAGVWEAHLDRVLDEGLRTGDPLVPGGLITQGPLKVVTDGSLNTRTAFCHDPYPGTGSHGILSVPPEHLVPLMHRVTAHGLTCAIHAIGDHANTLALDAFAESGARGTIEHAQLLTDRDVARFAELGVIASVQPEHAMDDRDVADRHWAGRTGRAFALGSLHAAGVRLVLGSDAPVAPLDPWIAVDAAVRRSRDGRAPWHPEQRIDLLTALAASVDGQRLGLAVGAPADLAVLDADPLTASDLRTLPVAGTLIAGRWTHRAL
jgi:predicted amidohydrolase YtcJ